MMGADMYCGFCDSALEVSNEDSEEIDDTQVWFLLLRFANAHGKCGYVTAGAADDNVEATEPDSEQEST